MVIARDLSGQRFGRWTVIGRADDSITKKGYHNIMWHCVCDCGTSKDVRGKSLTEGISKSCGCLMRECVSERMSQHNGFGTRLYAVWNSMRQRCNNPNNQAYENYGGRGISICPQWDDFGVFRAWAESVGYRDDAERGELTLDRIDVDKDYSPDNCRFVDMRTQANNRRRSIIVEYDGESHPLSVWAEILGVQYPTLWKQYKNGQSILN